MLLGSASVNWAILWATGLVVTALGAVTPAHAEVAAPESYQISVGDELEFDILDDSEPPQRFTVGRDGEVQLPFIGGVEVASVSISAARDLVRQTYVEREIFVDPTVELSIASFRPISVLGDVRNPGNFDYQPFMTAEQAVGLAGGPAISANNEEARVLERRNLEGTLNSLEFDLALVAAQFARVQAQLNGDDTVEWSYVPPEMRDGVNRELFDEHKVKEDQIIALDAADTATRRSLLTDAVAEAENRLSLLDQREAVQSQVVEYSNAELTRYRDLVARGLVPKSNLNDRELQASQAESQLLQLKEQRSAVVLQLTDLRSQLSQFESTREARLLTESQQFGNEIKKLVSARASLEDRMRLLQQWMNAAAGLQTEILVEFQVRRRENNGVTNLTLKSNDELLPGDLLVIVVKPPEALGEPG